MIKKIFTEILHDNFSGSGQILQLVQKVLLKFGQEEENPDMPSFLDQLEKLEQHFSHFALLFHFLNHLKSFLSENSSVKGSALVAFVRQYQHRWENAQKKASKNLLQNIPLTGKQILLHSNSSAIRNLCETMAHRKIFPVIWQTVSSPANEGLVQAEFLEHLGFDVHLFHEDAVSKFMANIDMAVFGADLLWDELFLNKIGTLPLALTFQYFQKPVYVLAETRKKIDTAGISKKRLSFFLHEQPKQEDELSGKPVPEVRIHNYYFEQVPLSLTNGLFLEKE